MSILDLRLLDGDDPETVAMLLPGFRETMRVALPDDPPVPEALLARLLQRRRDTERLVIAATNAAGRPLGYVKLGLDLAVPSVTGHGSLWVFPSERRAGTGSRLLEAARRALSERGRTQLLVDAPHSAEADAFVLARGGAPVSETLRLRITRATVEGRDLAERAATELPGQRIVRWTDRCPDDLVDAYAFTWRALDQPVNGQASAAWVTAASVRTREEETRRAGHRPYTVAAVAEDGTVTGYATMVVRNGPMGDACEVMVLPAARRHGIATRLKAELLRWAFAHTPELTTVQAWNDTTDEAVTDLNRSLGHESTGSWATWEFPV